MRLSQTARKLNVGTGTIINYLASQGTEISNKPNSKLSLEHVALLEKAFSISLTEKEKTEKVLIEIPEKAIHPDEETLTHTAPTEKDSLKKTPYNPLAEPIHKSETPPTPTTQGITMLGKLELTESLAKKREKYTPLKPVKPTEKPDSNTIKSTPVILRSVYSKLPRKKQKTSPRESIERRTPQIKKSKYQKEKKVRLIKAQEVERKEALKEQKLLTVTEFITANELAALMNIPINKLLTTCMNLGIIASINQRLDPETIVVAADELGFEVKFVTAQPKVEEDTDAAEDLLPKPPVVTVMGHVDHGKTSLLDYIRKDCVIEKEAGNITQHIGAYEVYTKNHEIVVFLDTPGHEDFTAMRARGVQITDIAIIIIAADDGVMPQTREAISHAQLAGTPIIIAINKIDKPSADPKKVKEQLAQLNIMVEDWGGKYSCQEISAKKGQGIEQLLEKILLQAQALSLKANPNKKAQGVVIEASIDQRRGYLTTIMVKAGTLKKGEIVLAGSFFGRIKTMFNAKGIPVEQALPAIPVQILGLNGAPSAGENFRVVPTKQTAREEAAKNTRLLRNQRFQAQLTTNLQQVRKALDTGSIPAVNILIKGDVDGSIEAISDALLKLSTEKLNVKIIYKAVGQVLESDVILASASHATIIGFQTKITPKARAMATDEKVNVKLCTVIYDAIDYMKSHIDNLLTPVQKKEIILGKIEVKKTFVMTAGTIAGCQVIQGTIKVNHTVRCKRKAKVLYTGPIKELQQKGKTVQEAKKGSECGISFDNFNDILVGDSIEVLAKETSQSTSKSAPN